MRQFEHVIALVAAGLVTSAASVAEGQEDACTKRHACESVELAVAGAFSGGAGRLRSVGEDNLHFTGPGGGVGVLAASRLSPHLAAGVSGDFEAFMRGSSWTPGATDRRLARSMRFGLEAIFHTRPDSFVDPWFQVGGGYRAIWVPETDDDLTVQHGPQLFRLRAGIDLLATRGVAFGPWGSAEVGYLTWSRPDGLAAGGAVGFFQAGVQAMFNLESLAASDSPTASAER